MYRLKSGRAIKRMTANELRDFIYESMKTITDKSNFLKKTVITQWNIRKKQALQLFGTILIEKIPDPTNVKQYYQSYLKLVSAIYYQTFIFSPNESPSKTIKQVLHFINKALCVLKIFNSL